MSADRWFILAVGAVAAYLTYRLMVDPGTRRPQFRGRRFSRRVGLAAALAVFVFCALLAWANGFLQSR
jgi:hypothetical protein